MAEIAGAARSKWQIGTQVTVEVVRRGGAAGQVGGAGSRRVTVSRRKSADKSESPTPEEGTGRR